VQTLLTTDAQESALMTALPAATANRRYRQGAGIASVTGGLAQIICTWTTAKPGGAADSAGASALRHFAVDRVPAKRSPPTVRFSCAISRAPSGNAAGRPEHLQHKFKLHGRCGKWDRSQFGRKLTSTPVRRHHGRVCLLYAGCAEARTVNDI
jgi:hypothetical protein